MTNTLSEQNILSIWEFCHHQHPVECALTVLAVANPSHARAHLLAASVGQRDTALLAIREQVFGSSFASYAECPRCRAALEFAFSANDIRVGAAPATSDRQILTFECDGYMIEAHLPDSADQLAIVSCGGVASARALLLQRCIVSVAYQGVAMEKKDRDELPENVIAALGEAIVECDPQAEIRLKLVCPSCDHSWFAAFDILTFLWKEITTHARRILRDVHILASAYRWSESEILALSGMRRRFYLEMVAE
ncbi:MAG: T4 family baseplate hub assembly chaperone [Ktedonobacteraceae bacterium]